MGGTAQRVATVLGVILLVTGSAFGLSKPTTQPAESIRIQQENIETFNRTIGGRIYELWRLLKDREPNRAKLLKEAFDVANKEWISQDMKMVIDFLNAGKLDKAVEREQTVIDALNKVLEALRPGASDPNKRITDIRAMKELRSLLDLDHVTFWRDLWEDDSKPATRPATQESNQWPMILRAFRPSEIGKGDHAYYEKQVADLVEEGTKLLQDGNSSAEAAAVIKCLRSARQFMAQTTRDLDGNKPEQAAENQTKAAVQLSEAWKQSTESNDQGRDWAEIEEMLDEIVRNQRVILAETRKALQRQRN
jgi:hypothetical protein